MRKYIREFIRILSLTLGLSLFPHFVLALPGNLDTLINKKVAQMTLDEKVGQLFIVGFPQKKITPELESFISRHKPGSYLLFKRNISSTEQIRTLNENLYRISFRATRLPPLIAIDQEGGAVSRLPIVPAPPNALALGQTQSPLLAEEMGFQTGLFLREVGFNMNLAPVLDVSDALSGSFIGVRSFGANPQIVGDVGVAYARGLLKSRVVPTAKHFPGTGDLKADPHYKVVENPSSSSSIYKKDLPPYKDYAKLGPQVAVMLSHYIYPSLDITREPASFSKRIVGDILRNELQYQGLVITDDLQMQGSRQLLRPEAAALKALQAGADIVMLTYSFSDQGKAFDYVKKSVSDGRLAIDDIDKKIKRILTVKAFANLYRRDPKQPSLLQGKSLTSSGYQELESSILEKNLKTALMPSVLPPKRDSRTPASQGSLCVLAPTKKFLQSFSKNTPRSAKTHLLVGGSDDSSIESWIEKENCENVLFAVTGAKTASLVKKLHTKIKEKCIVINLGSPKLFAKKAKSPAIMNLYFNHEESGKKVAEHLEQILSSSHPHLVLR